LLYNSLIRFGILGLGNKEALRFTRHEDCYEEIVGGITLYRKIK
jgi:chemotaxis protein methyltransferase CheR